MQWDHSRNMGFSEASEEQLYLPYDHSSDAPCVADQTGDESSLLAETRRLTALRHQYEDLQADADFAVIRAEEDAPFVYRRGNLILAVNPSSGAAEWESGMLRGRHAAYRINEAEVDGGRLVMGPQAFVVLEDLTTSI